MEWVYACIILIISSTTLYLSIRKARDLRLPIEYQNLLMFACPAVFVLGYNLSCGVSFAISPEYFAFMVLVAFFFSYLGNVCSLKAIENAPNPGYSLIISKSYVVLSTLLSVWLFDIPVGPLSLLAIALIVGFAALIMFDKNTKDDQEKRPWILYTLGAMLGWAFLALSLFWLVHLKSLAVMTVLFYLMAIVSVFILAEIAWKKVPLKRADRRSVAINAAAIGTSAFVFNLSIIAGYQLAPNPGYVNAANTASIFLVTIMSYFFFHDKLSARKLVGVAGVIAGLFLLFLF